MRRSPDAVILGLQRRSLGGPWDRNRPSPHPRPGRLSRIRIPRSRLRRDIFPGRKAACHEKIRPEGDGPFFPKHREGREVGPRLLDPADRGAPEPGGQGHPARKCRRLPVLLRLGDRRLVAGALACRTTIGAGWRTVIVRDAVRFAVRALRFAMGKACRPYGPRYMPNDSFWTAKLVGLDPTSDQLAPRPLVRRG